MCFGIPWPLLGTIFREPLGQVVASFARNEPSKLFFELQALPVAHPAFVARQHRFISLV